VQRVMMLMQCGQRDAMLMQGSSQYGGTAAVRAVWSAAAVLLDLKQDGGVLDREEEAGAAMQRSAREYGAWMTRSAQWVYCDGCAK
jgi:hypothetical protein